MGLSILRFAQLAPEALRAIQSFNVLIEILRFLAQKKPLGGEDSLVAVSEPIGY
jgi:hypothetical protein